MLIFTQKVAIKKYLNSRLDQKSIGFVPTMGALHDGHLSLIKTSISENSCTVVSIFVNPTQFNNPIDLEIYPRTLESDVQKIKTISDNIIVFAPEVKEIYGDKMQPEAFDFDGLEHQMEGKHRPGHFNGVGTIVKKLFEIINPTNAYFGEKDFQQLQIIKKLVEKQDLKVKIVQVPIFREKNGLAMSSRNERLSDNERQEAALIFKTLSDVKERFKNESAPKIQKWVGLNIQKHSSFRLEYFEIADEVTLQSCIRKLKNTTYRAFIAVYVNEVRLIDTMSFLAIE
jgi:pantoate--beta-alanine ligase